MSNLNENDITEYQETKGHFEVRLSKIPVFDQETGEEIRTDEQYTVCSKYIEEISYPCYDEETAIELCDYLNVLTRKCDLDDELPEPVNIDSLQLEGNDLFVNLALKINEKHELIRKLQEAKNHELSCKIDYTHKTNQIKLHPNDVKEDLELSKNPTEKQINAYCEEKYQREFDMYTMAKANTSLLNTKLDLINDYISLEKYIIRMRLK